MKATSLFKVVAVAVTLLLSVSTNAAIVKEKKLFTNEVIEGDMIVSKIVYEMDSSLTPYMKYDYTYDNEARIVAIEVLKWDSGSDKWEPSYKTSYLYKVDKIGVELGYWDKKHKAFDKDVKNYECELSLENIPEASAGK